MTRLLAVIPVRMAAQRLPGKPLAVINGRSVVEWVHRRTELTGVFERVIVATSDFEIAREVESFGGEVAVTRVDHETGTDRVAEVAASLPEFDVVANVQGDQPFVDEILLRALVQPYVAGHTPDMVTIGAPLPPGGHLNADTVKVVSDLDGRALYFSRSPIPFGYQPEDAVDCVHHHLGLYAFTNSFLQRFAQFPSTPLERAERLEQLRALEHGATIRVTRVPHGRLIEINTPEDLQLAREHGSELE